MSGGPQRCSTAGADVCAVTIEGVAFQLVLASPFVPIPLGANPSAKTGAPIASSSPDSSRHVATGEATKSRRRG